MDCKQCRDRLHDFLDETLEAAERAQVSAHVADCAACRRELEELRKAAALISSLDELPEPAGFLQAVRERIAKPTLWERFEGLLTRPLRPGFSVGIPVIIVAGIAVFVAMNLPPRSPQRPEKAAETDSEDAVEMAYAFDREAPSASAEEGRSLHRGKGGPPEAVTEPVDGYAGKIGRSVGYKEKETTLGDADSDAMEKATTTNGAAKGDEAAGELKAATEIVTRDEAEDTQGERTPVTEQRAREGATTTAVAGGTAARNRRADEADEAQEVDLVETELAEAEEAEANDATGDRAEGEDTEQAASDTFFLGAGGPKGDVKDSDLGDEQVIRLIVYDLPTDLSNVQKIADEEGGQLVEKREKDALTGLVVQVPTGNYERAVQRFSFYNAVNTKAVEQEKDQNQDQTIRNNRAAQLAKGQQRRGWLKPLPLIVQRIVKKAPADE